MAETWRYRGQEIGSEQIAFLREFIAAHPTSSRWKLSRQVVRSPGLETGQRRVARRGLPRPATDAGAGRPDRVAGRAPTDPRPTPDGAPPAGSDPDRHYAAGDATGGVGADRDHRGAAYP